MASTALRPRSATEIVDAAFQILRAHYGQFVMCAALAFLPWLIIQLVFLGDPQQLADANPWIAVVALLGLWMTFALMSAVIVSCASQAYLGDAVDVAAAVRRAVPRLPRVMGVALLRYLLLFLGLLCLLVGALYVAARFFALMPSVILEGATVTQAFRRSSALSRGRKLHILNTLGLVAIIYWAIAIGIMVVAAFTGSSVVQAVAGATYTMLVYPVIAITECLLYYDARIQAEGLDIELMTRELGAAPVTELAGR
ncbi:hypothetical protein BH11GEM1_BH11GEM1_11660 [soil metagenome]